jgi:hypothetical protein
MRLLALHAQEKSSARRHQPQCPVKRGALGANSGQRSAGFCRSCLGARYSRQMLAVPKASCLCFYGADCGNPPLYARALSGGLGFLAQAIACSTQPPVGVARLDGHGRSISDAVAQGRPHRPLQGINSQGSQCAAHRPGSCIYLGVARLLAC